MNYNDVKKSFLRCFVVFLGLTAAIAIISVLSGEFGELQWKILATTFAISAASICSMSCAAFIERKRLPILGLSGIVLSVVAAVLVIAGMWRKTNDEEYWKTTVSVVVFAVGFAHAFLLILPQLDRRQLWFQLLSVVSIGVLAGLIAGAVWLDTDNEDYLRVLAVAAIVVGLETLVTPILVKLRKGNVSRERDRLILERVEDGTYRDSAGRKYELKEV